jgi:hypothetical protein
VERPSVELLVGSALLAKLGPVITIAFASAAGRRATQMSLNIL